MSALNKAREKSSSSSAQPTARAGARAVLAAVALVTVAVPFALTLLLVAIRWAPLRSADQGARDSLHRYAVSHAGFVTAMQLISDSGSALAWLVVLAVVVVTFFWRGSAPAGPVRDGHGGRVIAVEHSGQGGGSSTTPRADQPGCP